jgi:hypothetical protein
LALKAYYVTKTGFAAAVCWANDEQDMMEISLASSKEQGYGHHTEADVKIRREERRDHSTFLGGRPPKRGHFVMPEFFDRS